MHTDILQLMIRNIFLLALLTIMLNTGNAPLLQEQLLRIWKSLKTPIIARKNRQTNHKSNKFWVIDMTDFEP